MTAQTAALKTARVIQITAVVLERELKLRQALKTMGMMDSTFWTSWTTYELVMGLITALLLAGFGAMWQVRVVACHPVPCARRRSTC